MKKITIGIPRALYYYRYGILWKNFFSNLGCHVIVSPETNQEIIDIGVNNSTKKTCLPYTIFLGHAIYLSKRCDYLLLPRVGDYNKNDKVCPRHSEICDYIRSIISKKQILNLNINHKKYYYQPLELFRIALRITINPIKIIYSYLKASKKQKYYNITKQNEQKNKLLKPNKKVLIVSQFYNTEDSYFINKITKYLEKENIIFLYSNQMEFNVTRPFSEYLGYSIPWKHWQEMVGAIYYYKYQIDGIIILSIDDCPINKLIIPLVINKNKETPTLEICTTEISNKQMVEDKLKSFINKIN